MIVRKLLGKRGESLVEAMAAMVVIVLVVAMLPTAVTAAARVNKQASEIKTVCPRTGGETITVTIGEKVLNATEGSELSTSSYGISSGVKEADFYYFKVG